jgi:hypothetical protein
MNITIDGLDTVKQLPWIGDRIIHVDYELYLGDLITRSTHEQPAEFEDDVMIINDIEMQSENNVGLFFPNKLMKTQLQQYILDQYHS